MSLPSETADVDNSELRQALLDEQNAITGRNSMRFVAACTWFAVQQASRVESLTKTAGRTVLVTAATRDAAGEAFAWEPAGAMPVRGKEKNRCDLLSRPLNDTPAAPLETRRAG